LEVAHADIGLSLTQKKYSLDILHRAVMLKCAPATTPMSATDRLSADAGELLSSEDATEYRRMLEVCSSSLILDQISRMRLTVFVSTFMLHAILIELLLSIFCVTYNLLFSLAYIFGMPPLVFCQLILMLTGLVVLMIVDPRGDMLCSLVLT
jgi:hypothetical protein